MQREKAIRFFALLLGFWLSLLGAESMAAEFDQYGGYAGIKGTATGFFHTEKIGDRWWVITPEGNAFFILSVSVANCAGSAKDEQGLSYTDYINVKYAVGQGPLDGFTHPRTRCSYYARERLRRWGFNTIGTFSHPPMTINFRTDPPRFPEAGSLPPNYMPQVITKRSGGHAMRDAGVKNLYGPLWGMGVGSQPHFPDVFDPAFGAFVDKDAQEDSWQDSPWVAYVFMDQTDQMRGVDMNHLHLGFIAAATAPTMTEDPRAFGGPKTYADPIMYTKLALRDFLRAKYGSLQGLNAAWGTSYTSWDSAGGWGVGPGFLDENGAHLGNWKSANPDKPSYPAVREDLDAFAAKLMRQFYRTVFEAYRRWKPNHPLATNNMSIPKRYVYEGLMSEDGKQVYADLIMAASDPDAGHWADRLQRPFIGTGGGFLTADNDSPLGYEGRVEAVEFDDVNKRVIITASGVNFWWAGSSSYKLGHYVFTQFSSLPPVLQKGGEESPQKFRSGREDWISPTTFAVRQVSGFTGTYEELKAAIKPGDTFRRIDTYHPNGPFLTQEDRGAQYAADLAETAARRSPQGASFIVGVNHWAWADQGWLDAREAKNFGLVTIRDNASDGVEASFSPGVDQFGFQRIPETPPPHLIARPGFGDFLSQVAQANLDVYEDNSSPPPPPPPPPDTRAPAVAFTAPTNGATVSGTVNVSIQASDDVGVNGVKLYLDDALVGVYTGGAVSYTWETTPSINGSHTLTARAWDAAGNVGSASITVNVKNSRRQGRARAAAVAAAALVGLRPREFRVLLRGLH